LRRGKSGQHCGELAVAGRGKLLLRHLLVIALRADHGGQAPLFSHQRAAIEHPLHEPVRQPEHGKGKSRARLVLQVAGGDRLVLEFGHGFGQQGLQLVRADGQDHRRIFAPERAEVPHRRPAAHFCALGAQPVRRRLGEQAR
jgi:hypothetical protein